MTIEKIPTYITTTLPYVNADPHIGHALEFVQADAYARFLRKEGVQVFFNTGTDEHGQKNWQEAQKQNKDVQEYVDFYAARFRDSLSELNISYDAFIRTTDEAHIVAAQELWHRCADNGDIYKKTYKGLYCVGCEMFVTEKELVNGECPNHPGQKPEEVEEENYFFRFSSYTDQLLELLKEGHTIIPESRRNAALAFLKNGLEDFSVSRLKERMSWGVPVPGDETQVMYVWFDALTNYISTLGWPDEGGNFKTFWEGGRTVQMAGKDQIRMQSLMWQAMLLSAGLSPTNTVFYHGFITSGGQKMSKSVGNVINPFSVIKRFGTDALRYILLRHVHPTEDSDLTEEKIIEWYNAHLANGIGNVLSRIVKMADSYDVSYELPEDTVVWNDSEWDSYKEYILNFDYGHACDVLWKALSDIDEEIAEKKPFSLYKTDPDTARSIVADCALRLYKVSVLLEPLLPNTSERIKHALLKKKIETPLFARIGTT